MSSQMHQQKLHIFSLYIEKATSKAVPLKWGTRYISQTTKCHKIWSNEHIP